jgi:hypothetical protein
MLRKGRWYELFFADLHPGKNVRPSGTFSRELPPRRPCFDLRQLPKSTEPFTGAEIS